MTHTPPVPPGNQSPYPIQEPPHVADAVPTGTATTVPTLVATATANDDAADEWAPPPSPARWSLGTIVGAAAGVGAIAIGVAAILFPRDSAASPKPKTGARRKPKSGK